MGGRWFVAGEGGVGGVAWGVARGGKSLGAGGRAKCGVLQTTCPHVSSVVSSAACGRCSLFAPVVGCTGGCPSRSMRLRSQGVARAFVRGTDVPLWFTCTPLASSSLMTVPWCGVSPGGDARLAQAISSALSTWVKTKATLRVRFASPSRRVLVVFFRPLDLSSARSGPWWGYRPCVGSGAANSLALCLESTSFGCYCCMSCLRSWLQRCPPCAVAVLGGADCRTHMASLSSCSLVTLTHPWGGGLSVRCSPPTGGLGPLPQRGEHLDVLPEERGDQVGECGAPGRRPAAHHCVRRTDANDGGRGEKGEEVRPAEVEEGVRARAQPACKDVAWWGWVSM